MLPLAWISVCGGLCSGYLQVRPRSAFPGRACSLLCLRRGRTLVSRGPVMLEPLAASVIVNIFSARPLTASRNSAQSAFKIMCRASNSGFPQTFFNPCPRPTPKGKERAVPEVQCRVCAEDGATSECVGNLATTSMHGEPVRTVCVLCDVPHEKIST